jgi:hypothetical protein
VINTEAPHCGATSPLPKSYYVEADASVPWVSLCNAKKRMREVTRSLLGRVPYKLEQRGVSIGDDYVEDD